MARTTPKQKLFISAYCSNDFNGTQAAIDAGYSENSAAEIATENLRKPHIAEAIDKYKQELADKHMVTVDSLIAELEEARGAALSAEIPQSSAAVGATMGKAKLCGLDKQIVISEHSGAIELVHLSKEDYAEIRTKMLKDDDC